MIHVENMTKVFKVARKTEGLAGAVRGLFKRDYEVRKAVNQISFHIDEGEVVGFIGPNGAGKTTTLKMLSGIMHPTNGMATVAGYVPWDRSRLYQQRISMVMGQKAQLWWDLPGADSFLLQKEIYRIPDETYRQRLSKWVDRLNVGHVLHTPVRLLSLGERMKMEMIGALLHAPEVLFLDEPTIGLDMFSQEAMHEFLLELKQNGNTTIILTSHYLADIERLCDRVIAISAGNLVFDGTLSKLRSTSEDGLEAALKKLLGNETETHSSPLASKVRKA